MDNVRPQHSPKAAKNNKSGDPLGFSNELFKTDIAGYDLKYAILAMMNKMKIP